MKKKIIVSTVIVAIFALLFAAYYIYNKNNKTEQEKPTEVAQLSPNFPYTISQSLSFVIRKSQLSDKYGKPQESGQLSDYNYDMWNLDDDSKVVAIYDNNNATNYNEI